MTPSLHLVKLSSPILQQLQWEEALLRADTGNWCLINQGSPPAIVMGISGEIETLVNRQKLETCPIPLIRRFSGGGTVVIDENTLFITLICRSDALAISPFPRSIMQWTGKHLYAPLIPSFQLEENDYTIEGKKWGGNAQAITKDRWLHHSSLLWDYCPHKMDYLHMPSKTPSYRQARKHIDFLCRLQDHCKDLQLFQLQVVEQLSQYFQVKETTEEEIEEVMRRPHRKATSVIAY